MPASTETTRYVSIQAAADHLGVHPDTIRRRIADGTLTGHRMGKRIIRVDVDQVDTLLRPIPTAKAG